MNEKILLVDDEIHILEGLQRILRKDFSVDVALGGEAALLMLSGPTPYAVIVADMRMPGIDGIQLLRTARQKTPDSVRLVLTGNADIQSAIDAVNEGSVFRFLTKPCPEDVLKNALGAALQQYRLIIAERELLEKTLHGSVKALTEVLSLVNPAAFSRASRVHRTVQGIARQLHLSNAWSFELAAMLSQIGCMALDSETVEAVYGGAELPTAEKERFRMHPSIAFDFLKKIPRLETVAMMIAGQQKPPAQKFPMLAGASPEAAELGADILALAIDFDQLSLSRLSRKDALARLRMDAAKYNPLALAALEKIPFDTTPYVCQEISIREMTVGMILDEDLRAPSGLLLVARDQEISYPLLVRIRNFCQKFPVANRIRVKVVQPEEILLKDTDNPTPAHVRP